MANANSSDPVLRSSMPQRGAAQKRSRPTGLLVASVGFGLIGASVIAVSLLRPAPATVVQPAPFDACALPAGTTTAALSPTISGLITARQLLCADFEDKRLSRADYDRRVGALDDAIAKALTRPAPALPAWRWANAVAAVSSQYGTDSWSAMQATGAPNVPAPGDHVNAWAPLHMDAGREYIELSYHQVAAVSAIDIRQNLGAGAIERVELIEPSGASHVVLAERNQANAIAPVGLRVSLDGCTDYPVARVRITLDTSAVSGWNEIDAVGLASCQ